MFDILASSYMSATRMDQFLEQDFMHRNPRMAQRLRHIHGLDTPNPSLTRQLRGRIGMDGYIRHADKPSRIAAAARKAVAVLGKSLRRLGAWIERTAETSQHPDACPTP